MQPTQAERATPSQRNVLRGAIFIMATSSIGPAFLTQTSLFTEKYLASFAFAILVSLLIDIGAQLNIWRIITVANLRGQDVANRVIPGVGHLISAFIVLGGIAFNIGNIGGAGLAMNVIFGIPPVIGSLIAAVLIIGIFLLRNAKGVMDSVMQVLGLVMLCMIGYAMLQSSPPLLEAVNRSFNPDDPLILLLPIVTLVGGTVGGYISFSGGHRLVEAGITGVENVRLVTERRSPASPPPALCASACSWPRSASSARGSASIRATLPLRCSPTRWARSATRSSAWYCWPPRCHR